MFGAEGPRWSVSGVDLSQHLHPANHDPAASGGNPSNEPPHSQSVIVCRTRIGRCRSAGTDIRAPRIQHNGPYAEKVHLFEMASVTYKAVHIHTKQVFASVCRADRRQTRRRQAGSCDDILACPIGEQLVFDHTSPHHGRQYFSGCSVTTF